MVVLTWEFSKEWAFSEAAIWAPSGAKRWALSGARICFRPS